MATLPVSLFSVYYNEERRIGRYTYFKKEDYEQSMLETPINKHHTEENIKFTRL